MIADQNPRILIDARPLVDPKIGGVRRVSELMLNMLVTSDIKMDFTCVTTGSRRQALPSPFDAHDRVTHTHIPWPNKLWTSVSILGTNSLDREVKRMTGQTHVAAIVPNLAFTGYLEIPFALLLHDLSFLIEPHWFSVKDRLWHMAVNAREQARRADRIFCVSETTARDAHLIFGVPQDKIQVIYPGTSALPNPGDHTTMNGRYVLALGGRDPRKNARTAIDVVRELRRVPECEDLQLVLVGAEQCKEEWITAVPNASDEELASLYSHASAFLYPSWYEGFGIPPHEAARYGIPILASIHGALPETAPAGSILIPPMKPQLWTQMLREVLRHPGQFITQFNEDATTPNVDPMLHWLHTVKPRS